MMKAYKFRIYPSKNQKILLEKTFGCVRFLWNKNVESFNNKTTFKSSTELRHEFEFLKDVSAASIQQKEIDFKQFKKQRFSKTRKTKIGNPSFKKKNQTQSFRLPNQKFKLLENKIQLEKIGKIKIIFDRQIPITSKLLSVTVSKDTVGDYFVSILVDEIILHKEKTNKAVGIDVGIKTLITTSDGLQVKHFTDNQSKIKKIQKYMSRKNKGSFRYKKLKLKFNKLHKQDVRRKYWLFHNISKYLVENYDVIVMEDLNISGMLKNHKLANSIQKSSWSNLIRMIEYKSNWYGKEFIKINRWFPSSKMCSNCGSIKENLTLADRTYNCDCGLSLDRDYNASINIKAVGVATAQGTVMESKTLSDTNSITQAIPSDLFSFL